MWPQDSPRLGRAGLFLLLAWCSCNRTGKDGGGGVVSKFTPLPISPIGDPSCDYCKKCSCYKVCFSGMKGFPDTSSNFGRSQAHCASHEDGCGVKHFDHQATLAEFYDHLKEPEAGQLGSTTKKTAAVSLYDHSANSMNLQSDTSTEVIKK